MDILTLIAMGAFVQTGVGYQTDHGACRPGLIAGMCRYDNNEIVNPKGVLELGWEGEMHGVEVSVSWRHESMILAQDYGMNGIYVGVKWHPFKR